MKSMIKAILVLRQGRFDRYRACQSFQDKAQSAGNGGSIGKGCNAVLNLEKSVGSQKSTQALNVPSKLKNLLITNKVITQFYNSLCTSISCMSFLRSTDFSRLKALAGSFLASRKAIIRGVAAFEKGTPLSCKLRLGFGSWHRSTFPIHGVVAANRFPARCIHQTYLVGVLIAVFLSQSVVQAESRIAAVNINNLMEQAPQTQLAGDEMKQRFAEREKNLVLERNTIRELEEQYKRDKDGMSSTKREEMEQHLREKLRDYKRDSDNFTEDFNMARNEALDRLQNDVYKAIVNVAEKEKYDLVLSESVLYASGRMDITDKVLLELKTLQQNKPQD